ncbi:MAG TPA: hypothetical protein VF605_10555 [Allosphingosinicella sp.]|jgi:hypothetical protein
MRAVAAFVVAAAFLQSCSRAEEERGAIFVASLAELGKTLKDPRLPVCRTLSERQPLARRSWAFIQGEPPAGFDDLIDAAPVEGTLSIEPLRAKLPGPWFLQDRTGDICFQFTRPAIRDRRAVVTGAFGGAGEDLLGTWNFWLRRDGGRWRVVATTKGNHNI